MYDAAIFLGAAYDKIASDYDSQWTRRMQEPQQRLTRELRLKRGERCVDLGCGTGVDTVDMLRTVAPGQVWGVDCSMAMLDSARLRARAVGLSLETRCQSADDFIRDCPAASFDVITLRFCLGYLDWRVALPRLPQLLRAGGRVGIVTILASSAPQALATCKQMASELGIDELPLTALPGIDPIRTAFEQGGGVVQTAWTHRARLDFHSGTALAAFLQTSGIATSSLLARLPADTREKLSEEFARRVEAYREGSGIPLDFDIAGLVVGPA